MSLDEDQLVERYRSRVLYFALSRLRDRNAAEEVAQEVLLAVLDAVRKDRLYEPSRLSSFVFGVASNVVKKRLRGEIREERAMAMQVAPSNTSWLSDPEARLLVRESREQVQEALARLRQDDRELLRRCFEDPLPLRELAGELGLTHAALRKRKERALARLKKLLDPVTKTEEREPTDER